MIGDLVAFLVIYPVLSVCGWLGVVLYADRKGLDGTGIAVAGVAVAAALVLVAGVAANLGGMALFVAVGAGVAALGAAMAVLWPLIGRRSGAAAALAPVLLMWIAR